MVRCTRKARVGLGGANRMQQRQFLSAARRRLAALIGGEESAIPSGRAFERLGPGRLPDRRAWAYAADSVSHRPSATGDLARRIFERVPSSL
jgi:hypothetical protein